MKFEEVRGVEGCGGSNFRPFEIVSDVAGKLTAQFIFYGT